MKRAVFLFLAGAVLAAAPIAAQARHIPAKPPVVVELFTAQGCASCGKANAFVATLAERPGLVTLTWSVDYWDYLGWKDTFAQPEFADRQRAFDKHFGLRDVYTPQVIVDGATQASGAKPEAVEKLLREARKAPGRQPSLRFYHRGERVAVSAGAPPRGAPPRGGAEVWLIRYDSRAQEVEVKDGDNRGHTVTVRNVVRQAVKLGTWRGKAVQFIIPEGDDALKRVVLLQAPKGGRILGVLQDPAKP
ncbi:MAG TPA: DUF1223 domain-containing protein [Caulobacteraceae bacterium]